MRLEIRHLSKTFGKENAKAVDDLSLTLGDESHFVAIVGPSGCGKTTLLRLIAGLESQDQGSIIINGVDVSDVATQSRDLAMVFQNFVLYPHLTVYENILSALGHYGLSAMQKEEKVKSILAKLGLVPYVNYKPRHLSDGLKQKVCIAKAMVREPSLLLLDEPFSNIDPVSASSIQRDLKNLNKESGSMFLYVTHNLNEAKTLGDLIVYMSKGRVVQTGTYNDFLSKPKSYDVMEFFKSQSDDF
jgi:ABC-type sugar transport system ATPase subunit